MEVDPSMNHLSFMLKYYTYLVLGRKEITEVLCFCELLMLGGFLVSTLACFDGKEENILKAHDALILFTAFLLELLINKKRNMARKMVEKILEHRQNHETSSAHSKIVREFTKEMNLYCKVVTTVYIAGALLYCTVSAHLTLNNPEECDREYVHLVIGWVHNSKYYFVLLFLNALCMFILFTTIFQWFLIVYCMILKIKCQIRLLCSDLDAINDYFDEFKNYLESNPSDGLVGRLKTSLNLSRKNENETETFKGKTKSALRSLSLLKLNREKFIEEQIKLYFKSIVQQHIQIIENVKVADITFRLSMIISVQLGVMIVAMTIPGLGGNVPTQELFHRGIEVLEIIGSIGLFNYFGQMVIDQSESLRQALYNCDWTDKPHSLRRGLLIMQIMASRPLKLTIGGIYTLKLETYGHILSTTYSYTSMIQSFN